VSYRGRFAPSPTGPLHFGSLVAALASYADARRARGEWLLRIEDVDLPRTREGAADHILRDLERLGFGWDGEVARQSMRTDAYVAALDALRGRGLAYRCSCTRRELAPAPRNANGEAIYPGHCRADPARGFARGGRAAWRVAVPAQAVAVADRRFGTVTQDLAAEVGDFVVRRSDGTFAYQLAVVVDDAAQGITDVVRGADLLASTPRQVLLQQALGLPTPRYLHVPVAVDRAGAKLSKHLGARALADFPLDALVAAWRFLGQEELPDRPGSMRDFWVFALSNWAPARLPSTLVQVAPEFALWGTET
jgi:glutamyl-Q tRNA(Asp) synthetase